MISRPVKSDTRTPLAFGKSGPVAHPNDTLNGALYAHEREDEKHLRNKLGYWRMVEERAVREELIAAGYDPRGLEFWRMIELALMANHINDVSFKVSGMVRQQAAAEREAAYEAAQDDAIKALREIADGHNDPRNLAARVLAALDAAHNL